MEATYIRQVMTTMAEVECSEEEQIWNRVTLYHLQRQMQILILKFYRSMMRIRDLLISINKLAESWKPPEKDFLGTRLTLTSKRPMESKERCHLFLPTHCR